MATLDTLEAVSAIDGRYHSTTEELSPYLSEYGLISYRLEVMVRWVIALSECEELPVRSITPEELKYLEFIKSPDVLDASIVKAIETTGYKGGTVEIGRTNHDVKACELYLRMRFEESTLSDMVEWIHFACTSEDVNNMAYALMLQDALASSVYPLLSRIRVKLQNMAAAYADVSMLARTHGQPASPTTLGKEISVFACRVQDQCDQFFNHAMTVKMNGASGNYNAHVVAFPEVDWPQFTRDFITSFNNDVGIRLVQNEVTTQIEPHDTYAELFDKMKRVNTVLIGLCQDLWRYVSDDWFVQRQAKGETGSSTMPHKVNPIDLENGEGNLGQANALLEYFSRKLPISRLQRDLSDSTVERGFGTAFAWSIIGYTAILRGLEKLEPNREKIAETLADHPEVITEAYQTVLRAAGYSNAYMALKDLSRGKKLTMPLLLEFVMGLEVSKETKDRLMAITPDSYTGLAKELAISFL